jgi:squalene cyclase
VTQVVVNQVLALFFLAGATPEQRAVDYLVREVPRWSRENHCFSCHNNGDAARALFAARQAGYAVPAGALADTTRWLLEPGRWDEVRGNPAASDKKLARIQFSAALAEAWRTGVTRGREVLLRAADSLLKLQETDGAWIVDTGGLPGAPATYGTALATYMARRTLETAGESRFAAAMARADWWFAAAKPESLLDAAAMLLALPQSQEVRRKCLPMLLASQTSDGGWGPQPHVPAEAFDTAVVVLALRAAGETKPIARARAFLISLQEPSGAWPETTRPSGGQSYAERISTAAWVTLALLE